MALAEGLVSPYTSMVGVLLQADPLDPAKVAHVDVPLQVTALSQLQQICNQVLIVEALGSSKGSLPQADLLNPAQRTRKHARGHVAATHALLNDVMACLHAARPGLASSINSITCDCVHALHTPAPACSESGHASNAAPTAMCGLPRLAVARFSRLHCRQAAPGCCKACRPAVYPLQVQKRWQAT